MLLLSNIGKECAPLPKCLFSPHSSRLIKRAPSVRGWRYPLVRTLLFTHVRCCGSKSKDEEEKEKNEEPDNEEKGVVTQVSTTDHHNRKKKIIQDILFGQEKYNQPYHRKEPRAYDYNLTFVGNNLINAKRARTDYLLSQDELDELRTTMNNRSAHSTNIGEKLYLQMDVRKRALDKWGSEEALQLQKEIIKETKEKKEMDHKTQMEPLGGLKKEEKEKRRKQLLETLYNNEEQEKKRKNDMDASEKVVKIAIGANLFNTVVKFCAWYSTGSAAMWSEALHSFADTGNQALLLWGIRSSHKQTSAEHPYGYEMAPYLFALISGCGIFCVGAGLTIYHGISSLRYPAALGNLGVGVIVLLITTLSESYSLWKAYRAVKKSAEERAITFWDYMKSGSDPNMVLVVAEDTVAVLGNLIALACVALTQYTQIQAFDAVGSIAIGSLLGWVAMFIVRRNFNSLMGESIPQEQIDETSRIVENNQVVRSVHDIKAVRMGSHTVRWKCEVNLDGREISRAYLEQRVDLTAMLETVKSIKTEDELEDFFLYEGELIIDRIGEHIDKIEKDIKTSRPEIRHVDLEVL